MGTALFRLITRIPRCLTFTCPRELAIATKQNTIDSRNSILQGIHFCNEMSVVSQCIPSVPTGTILLKVIMSYKNLDCRNVYFQVLQNIFQFPFFLFPLMTKLDASKKHHNIVPSTLPNRRKRPRLSCLESLELL